MSDGPAHETHHRTQADGSAGVTRTHHATGDGPVNRCRLSGELDYATGGRMLEAITHAIDGRAGVLELHLHELRLCDAAGVTALLRVEAFAAEHGTRIRLCGAHGIVRRVFEIVGLDRAMQVV